MALPIFPPGYHRIQLVGSFDELVSTRFADGVNALCWPRVLAGDFREVVERLAVGVGITPIEDARLESLAAEVSVAGRVAIAVMLEDLRRLREAGLEPVLDGVLGYAPRSAEEVAAEVMRTDVCSWHVDSATCEADTWLCTYHGASSEGLPNEQALRRAEVPEMRAVLLRDYGGADDEGFLEYLNDHYYDLHYVPVEGSRGWSFGVGNLWRIATEHPGCAVPPCIHRAPDPVPGELPRLLLIS